MQAGVKWEMGRGLFRGTAQSIPPGQCSTGSTPGSSPLDSAAAAKGPIQLTAAICLLKSCRGMPSSVLRRWHSSSGTLYQNTYVPHTTARLITLLLLPLLLQKIPRSRKPVQKPSLNPAEAIAGTRSSLHPISKQFTFLPASTCFIHTPPNINPALKCFPWRRNVWQKNKLDFAPASTRWVFSTSSALISIGLVYPEDPFHCSAEGGTIPAS